MLKYGFDHCSRTSLFDRVCSGCTPLNCAAYIGKADFCDILLKNGADINAKDNE